ncbi:MAG TPA: alpha/beta fold hydrolase [Magnetospirillaceae bacterium]|nr:alpha/beta fold hydrolase [Magnetospirillaceae bacterium]
MRAPFRRDNLAARAAALLALPAAGALLALAATAQGAGALASAAGLAAVFFIWNLKPIAWKPRLVPAPPAAQDHLLTPEAGPVASLRGHRDLLFCLHGFPSTPADFRGFSPEADVLGYDLAAPLLPGCGTRPEDIVHEHFDSWLAYARAEYLRLRPRYDRVFLVGQSLGGTLALVLAEEFCAVPAMAPAAVATVGSPVVLNSLLRHGMVRHPLIYAARFLALFLPSLGAGIPELGREGEDGSERWLGYTGVFPRMLHSMQVRFPEVERRLRRVTCPVLVCHGRGDCMVDYRNAAIIACGVGSDHIETWTANMDRFRHIRHSLLLYDSQRDRVRERIFRFFGEFRG